jgi:hypothetical protein
MVIIGEKKMPGLWRTARVFISSTFKDMQAERDHLVRFVFPRLRDELFPRRIHLVDVDLRWGVTSEQDALAVCKEIINECRPRFLCILGGRYGVMAPGQEESITAAEIQYAALQQPHLPEYRFFYFRNPQVTNTIPEVTARINRYREFPTPEEIVQYGVDQAGVLASLRTAKLKALKQKIVDAGFIPCCYSPRWDESSSRIVQLEAFGEQVYYDLLWSIDDELGVEAPPEQNEFAAEGAAFETFIEQRVAGYVVGSRIKLLKDMQRFATDSGEPSILAITGAAGSGKSAILANFYQDYSKNHPEDFVIPHFVGVSIGSTNLRRTLRRFCFELSRVLGDNTEMPQDIRELTPKFSELLQQISIFRRTVLIIDALNQMDSKDNAHSLHWIPDHLPSRVRVIVSSLEHHALDALRKRGEQVKEEEIKTLEPKDAQDIISHFVTRYCKSLGFEQTELLLSKKDSGNPLYLLTALEELRTLGTYEEITRRIRDLPHRTVDLFVWILHRLEEDPGFRNGQATNSGVEFVRIFVSLIWHESLRSFSGGDKGVAHLHGRL